MMKTTILITLIFTTAMLISCHSPQKMFNKEVTERYSAASYTSALITEELIAHLPDPIQRYFRHCGFIGTPVTHHAEIVWSESRIRMKPGQRSMPLKTLQHNFVDEPSRFAYMRARILGVIPFEGRDRYHRGAGHMFGTIGRLFKVFDAHDEETARGAAIVLLAEALLVPSYAIQPYMQWETVDTLTVNARFVHAGMDVGGTFHFNEQGEYIRFTTNERPFSSPKGGYEEQPYTIEIHSYQQ